MNNDEIIKATKNDLKNLPFVKAKYKECMLNLGKSMLLENVDEKRIAYLEQQAKEYKYQMLKMQNAMTVLSRIEQSVLVSKFFELKTFKQISIVLNTAPDYIRKEVMKNALLKVGKIIYCDYDEEYIEIMKD